MHYWRRLHGSLYNAAVYNRKTQYQKFGNSVNYLEQQNSLPAFKEVWPEYKELGSHALQATLKRVDFAFTRFFKGLGGYPKFKAFRRYSGWTYPCGAGWKAETEGKHGHLNLSNLGRIQMRGKARTWGKSTTCTILFRNGRWYASITVQCQPQRQTGTGYIGIDLGCKDAITLSTGEKISKPDFLKVGQQKVKAASKSLRRKRAPNRNKRVKGSRRWKKGRAKVSQLQRQVTRQREDWLHKTTSNIVSGNSLIAGEQLNIKAMTGKAKKGNRKKRSADPSARLRRDPSASSGRRRSVERLGRGRSRRSQKAGLNRSILEVGFGIIGGFLEYKAAEAGGFYLESPTRTLKPTQRCAKCWELTPKTLSDRIHVCSHPNCGHTEDRDVNAAQVNEIWVRGLWSSPPELGSAPVRARGQELSSLHVESPSSTSC
ncbi:MAG: transposase [Kastovskya adunca ATA6-11-RM4]|nr:transposase [Kastovskya adunca ATA6-11-RM4]